MNDVKTLPKSLSALPDAPPEQFPRGFGSYMLLAPLARGGMGEVFLAKHGSVRGLEKNCVVKTLRPHLTDDREYTTRFIDEARIVVQLGHRNICHVFDVGTVGERYYLAMEYIAGKDLRAVAHDVGEKGGVVNPGLALHIVCETLEALDYAHRHKDAATGQPLLLVHRDVSPQNIMLSWEGEVKLIDFGLAASTLKMEQTSPNVVMGKLAYMAPEQVRGERVDGRADMFAAAVLLYEFLVGERFYEGRSPYEIWGLAAQGNFRPRGWDALDADMKAILEKALAGNPTVRHSSCLDLRESLMAYRFARGLHGDAPMLRALMQQVYASEIEDSRKELAALTAALPTDPLAAHPSGVFSVSMEPTQSLARSPSQSGPGLLQRAHSGTVAEATEPTEMAVKAMFGPRRSGPIVLAALIGLAMVLAIVGLAWSLHNTTLPPAQHTAVIEAAQTDPPPVDVKPVDTKPVDVKPVDVKPVDVKADVKPVDVKPADVKPVDVKGTAKPPDAKRPKADAKPIDTKPVDVKATDVGIKPVDTKPADVKPDGDKAADAKVELKLDAVPVKVDAKPAASSSNHFRDVIDAIGAKCPSLGCYQKLVVHRTNYAGLPIGEFTAWIAETKQCADTCGVPK